MPLASTTAAEPPPYSLTTSMAWFKAVEAWPWEHLGKDWVKRGPCPECHHPIDVTVTGGVRPLVEGPVLIRCNCGHAHLGAPEGTTGCGRSAMISPPPKRSDR